MHRVNLKEPTGIARVCRACVRATIRARAQATIPSCRMARRQNEAPRPMTTRSLIRFSAFLLATAMTLATTAFADDGSRSHDSALPANAAPSSVSADGAPQNCDGRASLAEKRACYATQSQASIDACERIHPMRCKHYRDMDAAEKRLAETEADLLAAAEKTYASYVEDDAAYLTDLKAAAMEANRAWRTYRDAQCALEPFAQGMSRNGAEDLMEACRVDMTHARIAALKALYIPSTGADARKRPH